ncbi:gamma-butyrobetaine hydroxylase-like domain-containing protein [Umboniibacter marinipuniceus]|uniref:DUF971 family protein n=1 Tax=Umboniibacter marinipuniceus TaxID=569599 RepID=A0A3M0A9R6_9GAMM|nr:DUF971 domain-containing protein [Umboniibacter marinipuniceus]RMA80249.1 DUF971 family protein [Umboniibacter marinipuniceus]
MTAPQKVILHRRSKTLELAWPDASFTLSAEYLRVCSPSAEVRGHGGQNEVLQVGKRDVAISKIAPSGHYAVQISFDDGHDTGLYSWHYLRELAENFAERWAAYLQALKAANQSRDADTSIVKFIN